MPHHYAKLITAFTTALLMGFSSQQAGAADQISISNFGVATGSFPWAIAQEKGSFKKHGVDISAVRSSPGSAPTMREMIAGNLPFAEGNITGVIAAIRGGADLKIVASTVNTFSDVIWVTMPNSPIKTINDIKGKRLGFTSPKSATNMLAVLLVKKAGLQQDEVQMIAAGGFPQALTALEAGGIDLAPMAEPAFAARGSKYHVLARSNEVFPAMSNVVGVTTTKAAKERAEVIRGILVARREAVEWMVANPKEASETLTKTWKVDAPILEKLIVQLRDHGGSGNVAYWGTGKIELAAMESMLEGAMTTGEITEAFDVKTIIDESFLPKDLQSKK